MWNLILRIFLCCWIAAGLGIVGIEQAGQLSS